MQSQLLSVDGIVLERREGASRFDRLIVLTREQGVSSCMQQRNAKISRQTAADIFDLGEFSLERRGGSSNWFVRDHHLLKRHEGIGRNYRTLQQASSWSQFVLKNALHLEDCTRLFSITCNALSAWDSGSPPAIVFLKALYVFAREEGLPVNESWLCSLGRDERQIADYLLRTPSPALNEWEPQGQELLRKLQRWLESEHEIRFGV